MVAGVEQACRLQFVPLLKLLHRVGERLVIGVVIAGYVQALAQLRNASVLRADLKRRPIWNRRLPGPFLAAAQFGEFGLQRKVTRALRLIAPQRFAHVGRAGDFGKNVARGRDLRLVIDVAADARPVHAAYCGVMRVGGDRERETQFSFRKRGGIAQRIESRRRIITGIETVGVDVAEIRYRRLRARVRLAVGQPQRRIIAAGIIGFECRSLLLAAEHSIEFSGGEVPQFFSDCGIAVGDRSGSGGRRRFIWRGRGRRAGGGRRHFVAAADCGGRRHFVAAADCGGRLRISRRPIRGGGSFRLSRLLCRCRGLIGGFGSG